jgi:hypothetical protein
MHRADSMRMAESVLAFSQGLKRFHNCRILGTHPPSGIFLKKKPPRAMPESTQIVAPR